MLDNDGGLVGTSLLSAAHSLPYTIVPVTGSAASLLADVDRGKYHAGFFANAGASAALALALHSNANYDPTTAISFVYDEGRGGSAMKPILLSAAAQVGAVAGAHCAGALLASNGATPAGQLNPRVLVSPVQATIVNLHPVPYPGMATVAGIAVIDLWIMTLAAATIMLGLYDGWEAAGVRRDQQIMFRIAHLLLAVGILSLWPPAVMAGLGETLSPSKFFAMWAFCWLFMTTFGTIIVTLFRSLGPALGNACHSLFLILNLVSSGAVTPIEFMPAFFRIGYGLPFCNAVQGLVRSLAAARTRV